MNEQTGNRICGEGVFALSKALKVNTTLTSLNLARVKQNDKAKQRHDNKHSIKQTTASAQKNHVH